MISQKITGWCLRNWNFPLSDHTHVCQHDAGHGSHHRCQCGEELGRGETP